MFDGRRCLMGAGGLAVIDPIIKNLGPGYGFSSACIVLYLQMGIEAGTLQCCV